MKLLLLGGHPEVHASPDLTVKSFLLLLTLSALKEPKHTYIHYIPKIRDNACQWSLILLSDFRMNVFALRGTSLHHSLPTKKLSFLMTFPRQQQA